MASEEANSQLRGSDAVQAGIEAGNINLASAGTTTIGLSESSLAAQEKHADMLRQVEASRLARSITVPTDPGAVIDALRALSEPKTLFGERVGDRRERLRRVMAERQLGAVDFSGDAAASSSAAQSQAAGAQRTEVVHTPASGALIDARVFIGSWSLDRAQKRLESQRARANASDKAKLQASEDAATADVHKEVQRLHVAASVPAEPRRPVSCCRFSPCGAAVATGAWSAELRLWDAGRQQALRSFRGHTERVVALAWRPGVSVDLAASKEEDSLAPDADGDVALGSAAAAPVSAVQFATGSADCTVKLWNSTSSTAQATLQGHSSRIAKVEWHPSGKFLASTSYDYTWRLWDVERQEELLLQDGHAREVYPVAFHPDGSLIATGDLGGIGRVWDLRSGRSVMTLRGHVTQMLDMHFSPNGVNLATASDDHTVNVWDLRARKVTCAIPAHSRLISSVRFAPNNEFMVTAAFDGSLRTWSTRNWTALGVHNGHDDKVTCVDVAPDSKSLVSCGFDKMLKFWEPEPQWF